MTTARDSRLLRLSFPTLVFMLFCSLAQGKIIYVDDGATGANDGTSWPGAYSHLTHALHNAASGDEIRVAQGIYRPDQGLMAIPEFDWRTTTFLLSDGLILKGGYAGLSEPDPNTQDAELYETILSGDLNRDDVAVTGPHYLPDEPTRADNSYHVVTITGPVVLEGVVITGGHASDGFAGNQNNSSRAMGGGLWATGEGIAIRDCIFKSNFAAERGGGLFGENTDLIIEGCAFDRNAAGSASASGEGRGGGMMLYGAAAVFTKCALRENAAAWGGAIHSSDPRFVELVNCLMIGNIALRGGAVFYSEGGLVRAMNCTAVGNSAPEGCFLMDISTQVRGKPPPWIQIENCILADGSNEISNSFGALTIEYTDVVVGDSAISDPHRMVVWGAGNIEADPMFAASGYWASVHDPNLAVEPNDANAVWIDGDYHLQSKAGRYDPNAQTWVQDETSSPCIDAGDPAQPFESEPAPNGMRVNMGAYGGTAQASKSDYSWWFATTQGPVPAKGLGIVLPHEHIFTDLRGPTIPGYGQYLAEALGKGVGLMFECSSIGVGRNVPILAQVSEASGLPVVVPTGVYGRGNFAPLEHRNMTEDELATLFVSEISEDIEGTGIKAGFIKISTDNGPLSPLLERILRAAGRAASETGAAIASHTPTGSNAIRQVDILRSISPTIRFIWVHAQNESNRNVHRQVADRGGYIEFDNLGWNPGQDSAHIAAIKELLDAGHGDRILLSHDAGWYRPGEPNGGTQKPYTYLIDNFIPKLKNAGIGDATIRAITETNPIRALGFKSSK
ncbi:MAG: phosphotriesterase family protein [Planctomycetota bacterium]